MLHPSGRLLEMASERQIAANRRNAKKSSGPRSAPGKKRASNNAYRHGLFSRRARAAVAEETEAFAHKIADRTSGAIALEHARIVAEAENELALIRDAKRALIDRTDIFGNFKTPRLFPTDPRKDPWLMSATVRGRGPQLLEAEDSLSTMQQEEAERSLAIKRVLSELTNLSLYEKRAAARRDRSIRRLMKLKQTLDSGAKSEATSKV
jgi:hypothetical protein